MLGWGDDPALTGGANVITRCLQVEERSKRVRVREGDVMISDQEPRNVGQSLEFRKGKECLSPPEPPGGTQPSDPFQTWDLQN